MTLLPDEQVWLLPLKLTLNFRLTCPRQTKRQLNTDIMIQIQFKRIREPVSSASTYY